MAVDVSGGAVGDTVAVFRGRYGSGCIVGTRYDVDPDGNRFLMTVDTAPDEIRIVQNWMAELDELVPTQ